MANKFWVGRAKTSAGLPATGWTASGNWASASGGTTIVSYPVAGDIVYFDANSGSGTSTLDQNFTNIGGLNCTGFTGTLAIPSPLQLRIAAPNGGSVILSAAATYSGAGSFFVGTSTATATITFTTNNALLNYPLVYILGTGQSTSIITLVGALTCKTLLTSTCTLVIGGNTVTCDSLQPYGNTTFAYGSSGTSQIVIPSGGGTDLVVVNQTAASCLSSSSGTQRPVIRLTYAGSSGSRVITNRSDVFDYVISGADVVKANFWCKNLDLSGFSGTLTPTGETRISGNLTFKTDTKWTSTTNLLNFTGTGTQNIDTKGTALLSPVTFSGTGGTYVLTNAMSMGSGTNTTTLTSGTLNLNGKTLTVVNFNSNPVSSPARAITFASGKIVVTGQTSAWIATTGTNLTITGPGSIELTGVPAPTSSRVFDGGSVVYNGVTLIFAGATAGTQNLIRGSNSFYSIRNTISPQTFLFVAGTTTIFTDDFELNGTAGNNIIIRSQGTPSGQANAPNFAKPSGTVVCRYATISQNNAAYIGGALSGYTSKWNIGTGSTLASTTTGWGKLAGTAGFITFFYP